MALWIKIPIIIFVVATVILAAILVVGKNRIKLETKILVEKLVSPAPIEKPLMVDFASLKELPKPVEKYFRNVLTDGQNFIRLTRLEQVGKLKVDQKSKKWSPFQASQIISQNTASFVWDAKINIAPLLHVLVRDSLIEGVGAGKVSLMSAIPIGSDENKAELNSGALYRYLAEAVWHPTALLPQSGVNWEPVDENKAIAHYTKYGTSISLEFSFNNFGEVVGIYTKERFGRFGDNYVKYPWEGRFSSYHESNGIKIPMEGDVGWHLPNGWWLFWKGRIVNAEFEFSN